MHRVPDEVLARALINSGFQPENVPSVLKTLRIAGAGAIGFSAELDPNAAEALGLILLTPGGYKLLTRAGSDMAILGRQLQYAKASSPLFQRLAQMDPANPSLSEVTIDRTAALTVGEAVSDGRVKSCPQAETSGFLRCSRGLRLFSPRQAWAIPSNPPPRRPKRPLTPRPSRGLRVCGRRRGGGWYRLRSIVVPAYRRHGGRAFWDGQQ